MKIIISAFILLQSFSFAQASLSDLNKLNNSQLDQIREKLSIQNPSMDSELESVDIINQESIEIEIEQKDYENLSSFFGYDYFNKQINFLIIFPLL